MLNGDTGPMVDGVGEAVVAGLSSGDDAALSGPLGDRRDLAGDCARRRELRPSLQGIRGFCEQRGEDGPSHSRQGCEDLRVMLLFLLRLGLLGWHEAGGQTVDPAMGVFDLTVEQAAARDEQSDMGARGFDRSGGDGALAACAHVLTTEAASKRRMRWRLSSLAIVARADGSPCSASARLPRVRAAIRR